VEEETETTFDCGLRWKVEFPNDKLSPFWRPSDWSTATPVFRQPGRSLIKHIISLSRSHIHSPKALSFFQCLDCLIRYNGDIRFRPGDLPFWLLTITHIYNGQPLRKERGMICGGDIVYSTLQRTVEITPHSKAAIFCTGKR
jgi:hypothetical protein